MNGAEIDEKQTGDIIGHAALLSGVPRTASLVASTDGKLVKIPMSKSSVAAFDAAKTEMEMCSKVGRGWVCRLADASLSFWRTPRCFTASRRMSCCASRPRSRRV